MRYLKHFRLFGLLVVFAAAMATTASAQVRVGVGIGVGPAYVGMAAPPVCAYGYYPSYPYACAPYGYYGPEWFANGAFVGAGPWFHGFRRPVFVGRPVYGRGFVAGRGPAVVGHGPAFAGRGRVVRGPVGGFHGRAVIRGR